MKVSLESTYGDLNFKGTTSRGQSIQLSGDKQACSPMEAVLMSVAGCSSIDIEIILKKMRQDVQSIKVEVEGVRRADQTPKIFTSMHLKYELVGKIKQEKAEEAVKLSLDKYCSVSKSLHPDIKITHEIIVIAAEEKS